MSLNGTPVLAEEKEIKILIIVSIATQKKSSKNCGRNMVFDLQSSLDSVITCEKFDELFQDMMKLMQLNYEN